LYLTFEDCLPIFCKPEIGDKPWSNEGLSSFLLQHTGRLQLEFQLANLGNGGVRPIKGAIGVNWGHKGRTYQKRCSNSDESLVKATGRVLQLDFAPG
jgi:hypothetical protein